MTTFALDYSSDDVDDPDRPYPVRTPDDLEQEFGILGYHAGELGSKLLAQLGPERRDPELLFGLDELGAGPGRAVIRWLPTGEFGYHPDVQTAESDIEFDGRFIPSAGTAYRYSPNATQVTPELVKNAIREYVRTGARPTILQWRAGDDSMYRQAYSTNATSD
jgi:hypothetical protein